MGALKLRHAAEAVGALAKYEAGEIGAADFPGHDVQVKLTVQKRRGYPDANAVEDYAPAEAGRVVNLRERVEREAAVLLVQADRDRAAVGRGRVATLAGAVFSIGLLVAWLG